MTAFQLPTMKLASSVLLAVALLSGGARYPGVSASCVAQPIDGARSASAVDDERGLVALDQALRDITNTLTVLCIAARTGDEDDAALSYLRKKLGARVVILFVTRGER